MNTSKTDNLTLMQQVFQDINLSIVVIGRNEEKSLRNSLNSALAIDFPPKEFEVIFIDSHSTDNSVKIAREMGVETLELNGDRPSAALARNTGWRHAKGKHILFLDGDTLLDPSFPKKAIAKLQLDNIGVVFGNLRELYPERSPYNRVFDLEWNPKPGFVSYCGGNALIKREVLEKVGGFNVNLVAGEEPEMCVRIKSLGYEILHCEDHMAKHDIDITTFGQYWRRCYRTGFAYAALYQLLGDGSLGLWKRRSLHNLAKGCVLYIFVAIFLFLSFHHSSLLPIFLICLFPVILILNTAIRMARYHHDVKTCFFYAIHSHFQHFPIFHGQVAFFYHQARNKIRERTTHKGGR